MNNFLCSCLSTTLLSVVVSVPSCVLAAQYSFESKISALTEYNDNIFITTVDHESVSGLKLTPQAKLLVKGENWQNYLNARWVSNAYSDAGLNSNDLLFDWYSGYSQERNVFSLTVKYNKDSSLNSTSSDFGIVPRRIKSRLISVTPSYQRVLSERSRLSLSVTRTEVDYDDDLNSGFVAYSLDTVSGSWMYALSERNTVSASLQYTDYQSDSGVFEYQLLVYQLGLQHQVTPLWSFNGSIGNSRRNSSNETTQSFNFFGQPITLVQVNEFSSDGLVVDVALKRKQKVGEFSLSLSRTNSTNSFGGLNEVSSLRLLQKAQWTELWNYSASLKYDDISAVSSSVRTTDRVAWFLELGLIRSIDRHWSINASYRYMTRVFDSVGGSRADSNRILIGMTYNFPDISTF